MTSRISFKDWGIEDSCDWMESLVHHYNRFESIHDLESKIPEYLWNPAKFVVTQSKSAENVRPMRMLAAFFTHKYLQTEFVITQSNSEVTVRSNEAGNGFNVVTSPLVEPRVQRPATFFDQTSVARIIQTPNYEGRLYDQTEVRMSRMNQLDLACQLHLKYPERTVVYVNIADRERHGGQWKFGYFGQEEYLYTRSAMTLATKPIPYKLDHWACLYTKSLRVIRLGEDEGYRFIQPEQQPVIDVVTVAGDGGADADAGAGRLFENHDARLRVKLEAILSMCVERGADYVVFGSSFPGYTHKFLTAGLKAIFEQFAGIFQGIYVGSSLGSAYENDLYMYGELMGPNEKLFPRSCGSLDEFDRMPGAVYLAPLRPWAADLVATNLNKPVCKNGGMCKAVDPEHYRMFEHPPFCPCGEHCLALKPKREADVHHLFMYFHKKNCPEKGICRLAVSKDESERNEHNNRFNHPQKPPHKNFMCKKDECLVKYLHEIPDNVYEAFLPKGAQLQVIDPHNKLKLESKAFCYKTPYCKLCLNACSKTLTGASGVLSESELKHMKGHMHICDKGKKCLFINDKGHARSFAHMSLSCTDPACPYGRYHSDLSRPECKDPYCENKDEDHLKKFAHHLPKSAIAAIPICGCVERKDKMLDYQAAPERKSMLSDSVRSEVRKWVETRFRPTIACSREALEAYITLGFIPGRGEAHRIWPDYKKIASIVTESVERTNGKPDAHATDADDMTKRRLHAISNLVKTRQRDICVERREKGFSDIFSLEFCTCIERREKTNFYPPPPPKVAVQRGPSSQDSDILTPLDYSFVQDFNLEPEYLRATNKVVKALEYLAFNRQCSVLGPHPCDLDGCTGLVVLREDVMHHPDFFVGLGETSKSGTMKGMIHPMNPKWAEIVADNMVKMTPHKKKVTFKDVVEYWSTASSDELIGKGLLLEAHLPSKVPLECVEKVFYTGKEPEQKDPTLSERMEKVDDLYTSAFKYRPRHHPVISGLCFVLSGARKREIFCPVEIPEDESEIRFRARGGDFYFSLSTESERVFSFYIDGTAHSLLECKDGGSSGRNFSGFNDGCNTDEFVEYLVCILKDPESDGYVLKIKHWGCSSIFNSSRLKRSIPGGVKIRYISFYSDATRSVESNYNATIAGLTIERKVSVQSSPKKTKRGEK